jgi:hypothetical protein
MDWEKREVKGSSYKKESREAFSILIQALLAYWNCPK